MPDLRVDEIITLKHKRNFIQYGGPRPANKVQFAGQDAQYMTIDGVSASELGGVDPIWVHDPSRPGAYRLVGRSYSPPDLAQASLKIREKHGSIPRQLLRIGCQFNMYELTGVCGDLSDFTGGWNDYILIYSGAVTTDKDFGTRTQFDADDPIEDTISLILSSVYPIGSLSFGEGATTQVDREVVDIVYGKADNCAGCDFGDSRIYAVVNPSGAGSPGLPAEVVYSVDAGATWNQMNIAGAGATESMAAIDVMGNYLVVIGEDDYYYSEINTLTGVPAAFTRVATGFVATKTPKDIYVAGPREAYVCANGGYIYKIVDVTFGVTVVSAGDASSSNLTRIKGLDDTILAVGASGAIVKSTNRGKTWGTTTTSPVSTLTFQSVAVLDNRRFWVGTLFPGRTYVTDNGGETWTEVTGAWSGDGNVTDIVFATQEVGYICHQTSSVIGRIYTTWDGGSTWTRSQYRILNWPVSDKINRVAIPNTDDPGYSANALACAGLAGNGTDGILLVGVAGKL